MSLLRLVLPLLPAVLLASCAMHLPAPERGVSGIETRSVHVASTETVPIYLLADKLHTALAFDRAWLEEKGFRTPAELAGSKWIVMSWGDEVAYVQERWLSAGQVMKALFTPSPSVMECIPIDWKVEQVCHHQRVFVADLPRSEGYPLAAFLNACAAKAPDGGPLTIARSSWGEGRLIRCPENYSYYFPRICNVWTAQALESCGYSINVPTGLSANGLVRQATSKKNGFRKIWDPSDKEPEQETPASRL